MIKIYKNGQWNTIAGYKGAILEVASFLNLPAVGSANTLYITEDDNSLYRWTGSTYVAISSGGGGGGTITDVTVNGTSVVTNNVAEIDLTGLIPTSAKGVAGGVAELDNSGQVPASQLPSYVDDVIDLVKDVSGEFWYKDAVTGTQSTPLLIGDLVYNSAAAGYMPSGGSSSPYYHTFLRKIAEPEAAWADDPATYRDNYLTCMEIVAPETGKIYVGKSDFKTYRWSGSNLVEISKSLALGETSSTAYAGNKGKANADAIAAIKDGTFIDSFADVEQALADVVHNPMDTQGDLIIGGSDGSPTKLAKGTSGQFLKMGSSNSPVWATVTMPRGCPEAYGYVGSYDVGQWHAIHLPKTGRMTAYTLGFFDKLSRIAYGTSMVGQAINATDAAFLYYVDNTSSPTDLTNLTRVSSSVIGSNAYNNGIVGIEVLAFDYNKSASIRIYTVHSSGVQWIVETNDIVVDIPTGKHLCIHTGNTSGSMRSWWILQHIGPVYN